MLKVHTACLSWLSVEKQPWGIKKQVIHKSAHLQQLCKQFIFKSDLTSEAQTPLFSSHKSNISIGSKICSSLHLMLCCITDLMKALHCLQVLHKPSKPHQKQKWEHKAEHSSSQDSDQSSLKWLWILPSSCTTEEKLKRKRVSKKNADSLKYWTWIKRWLKEYFKQDSQVKEDLKQDSWLEEQMKYSTQVVEYMKINEYKYSHSIKKLLILLCQKQLNSSLTDFNNQKKKESKSVAYWDTHYITLLEEKESYMKKSHLGLTEVSLTSCKTLLNSEQAVLKDSLFETIYLEQHVTKYRIRTKLKSFTVLFHTLYPQLRIWRH